MRQDLKWICITAILFSLSAYGGGGSSSGSRQVCTTDVAAEGDSSLPSAKISLPWRVSRTNQNTIVVKDTVSDGSGIKSVLVNSVPATCSPVTDIKVEVTDTAGNTDADADLMQITNRRAPTTFVFDADNNRVFGQLGLGWFGETDLLTGEFRVFPSTPPGFYSGAVLAGNEIFSAEAYWKSGILFVYSTDTDTGIVSEVDSLDLHLSDGMWPFLEQLAYDSEKGILYFLLTYFHTSDYELNQTHIFQYELKKGEFAILSSSTEDQGEPLKSNEMVMGNGELLVLADTFGYGNNAIVSVNTTNGVRTLISDPANVSTIDLAYDSADNAAYLTGFEGIARIDLCDGSVINISSEAEQDFYNFSQIRSTVVDKANNRLLVGDSDLDMLLAVDLDSGTRSKVLGESVGEGHPLIAPREMVVDQVNNRVFVADDGSKAPEAVFAIDLSTGDRVEIGNINQLYNVYLNDIAHDAQGNRLFVALSDEILAIDLDTEVVSTFSGGSFDPIGTGDLFQYISGMALDLAHQKLFVTDRDALIEVELASGNRAIASQTGVKGEGDDVSGATDVVVDSEKNLAYVVSQQLGALFKIDIETGDRQIILTECVDDFGENWFLSGEQSAGIQNIYLNQTNGDLWITAEKLLQYNIHSGLCRVVDSTNNVGIDLDIGLTASGQLLATDFNKLVKVDVVTGERVVISK